MCNKNYLQKNFFGYSYENTRTSSSSSQKKLLSIPYNSNLQKKITEKASIAVFIFMQLIFYHAFSQ